MSFVIAAPEMVASAASDLAGIGSMISEANGAAATSTTVVIAAAGDEVSAAILAVERTPNCTPVQALRPANKGTNALPVAGCVRGP